MTHEELVVCVAAIADALAIGGEHVATNKQARKLLKKKGIKRKQITSLIARNANQHNSQAVAKIEKEWNAKYAKPSTTQDTNGSTLLSGLEKKYGRKPLLCWMGAERLDAGELGHLLPHIKKKALTKLAARSKKGKAAAPLTEEEEGQVWDLVLLHSQHKKYLVTHSAS